MFVEHFFDLAWIDVVAAANDDVLLAVDDEVKAVVVASGKVAGVEPPVDDRSLGGLGPLPVTLHHVVPPDGDFAGLPRWGFGAVRFDQFQFDTVQRQSDRTGFGSPGTIERGGR